MNRKEKLKKLQEVTLELKNDFVGIDSTIDSIIKSVTPWYVTPELIERPLVVSVWGLTGTGKSSVIRSLLEKLDLRADTLFFDCGAEDSTDSTISDKICGFFDNTNGPTICSSMDNTLQREGKRFNGVFVFDEFQHSRTIDEDGREISKSSQRAVWALMDSGVIDVITRPYTVKELLTYTEELKYTSEEIGVDLGITSGTWPASVLPKVNKTLDFYKSWEDRDEEEKGGDSHPILSKNKKESLVNCLNSVERGLGYKVIERLEASKTIGEYVGVLEENMDLISSPKKIDCSKSLIFVIGNLDEAFTSCRDLDPDLDADVFSKIIGRTCIIDVKEALKQRFRVEQIGRLGNNMIIYPSLKKSDFKEIIEKELQRIHDKFLETSGINVVFGVGFKDLLYSEGVFPSQGVRPVFTTISTICLPKLSMILSELPDGTKKATIDAIGDFYQETITIRIYYGEGNYIESQETLNLGNLRGPKSCEKIAAHAVHEAGHAVMMTYVKGEIPEMILAQSSLGGGYTYGDLSKPDRLSAHCKSDVDHEVMIDLGGVCAEHLFFDDQHCTIGCTSDYQKAWDLLAEAAYKGGFFNDPYPWSCPSSHSDLSTGVRDVTDDTSEVIRRMKRHIGTLYEETSRILKEDLELIRRISMSLVDNRCMFKETYQEYLGTYGSKELREKASKADSKDNYWIKKLTP